MSSQIVAGDNLVWGEDLGCRKNRLNWSGPQIRLLKISIGVKYYPPNVKQKNITKRLCYFIVMAKCSQVKEI